MLVVNLILYMKILCFSIVKIVFLLFLPCVLCLGCNGKGSIEIEKELKKVIGAKLVLNCDRMHCVKRNEGKKMVCGKRMKIVVYSDSTVCSTCELNKLRTWENDMFGNVADESIYVCFIFQSGSSQYMKLCDKLNSFDIEHDLYVDTANVFQTDNPDVPTSKMLHTFLLDENDVVLLCGDPLRSMKMDALYKSEIYKYKNGKSHEK